MVNSKFAEVLPRIENASDDQEPMMSISAIAEEENKEMSRALYHVKLGACC